MGGWSYWTFLAQPAEFIDEIVAMMVEQSKDTNQPDGFNADDPAVMEA